jgi:hypothetical protein
MKIEDLFISPGEQLVLCKSDDLSKDIIFQPFFVCDGLWYGLLKDGGAATFKETKNDWIPLEIKEVVWVKKWKWVYQLNGHWHESSDYLCEQDAEIKFRNLKKEKLSYTEKTMAEDEY